MTEKLPIRRKTLKKSMCFCICFWFTCFETTGCTQAKPSSTTTQDTPTATCSCSTIEKTYGTHKKKPHHILLRKFVSSQTL